MVMEDIYLQSLDTKNPMIIDYVYYISKTLKTHVDKILGIAFLDQLRELQFDISHVKGKSKNPTRLITPVELICDMLSDGLTIDDFECLIEEHKEYLNMPRASE